jgi:RimJ/RimL family protein N-acetyltransferase
MPEIPLEPVVLEGNRVRLEPLSMDHLPRLVEIGLEGDIFRWYSQPIRTPDDMKAFIRSAMEEQEAGKSLPFATVERSLRLAVGSTRFMTIDRPNRTVEIGYTWIAPAWQRSAVNTEAKYLMMRCAFEDWGCNRVGLKTDSLNERSRRAIARVGAKEEGTLRNVVVTASGRLRHSVYFSVIREEWPEVKASLEGKLHRG